VELVVATSTLGQGKLNHGNNQRKDQLSEFRPPLSEFPPSHLII
jgi:hypothetical protein